MTALKITNIWLDDAMCDEQGNGMSLTVDLSNGAYFMINLDSKAREPLFCDVTRGKCGEPRTDGERVYWDNGASLTIEDMMELLRTGSEGSVAI